MNVLLETSPLRNANSIRGVGVYTRYLSRELEKIETGTNHFFTSEDIAVEQLNAFMNKKGIDVIHYPYFNLFQQTLPLPFIHRFLGRAKQKIVVTIHDVIPLLYPKYYPVGLRGNTGLYLQKKALQGVSAIITDSETSKQDIHKYLSVPLQKITSIPLAGNPELKKVSNQVVQKIKQQYSIPEKYVLYVGDINYNKNIPELLRAMKQVDQSIHLVCVGANFRSQPIPEWTSIENELISIKERVHFITTIPKEDTQALSALYTGAFAYIQPSLYEGFGLPLLEAMQCETIVISSNTPALLEIGGTGTEFVKPNSEGFVKGIQTIFSLSDQQRQQRIKSNSQRLNQFSWTKTAQQTVEVYKSIL